MLRQMANLSETVRGLSDGQHHLHGGLKTVADAQVQAQAKMLQVMEARLAEVQKNMAKLPESDREAIAAYLKAIPGRKSAR